MAALPIFESISYKQFTTYNPIGSFHLFFLVLTHVYLLIAGVENTVGSVTHTHTHTHTLCRTPLD